MANVPPPSLLAKGNPTPILPFMGSLNLLDLSFLTNDPIKHGANWLDMPTKSLYGIPNIESRLGDEPTNYTTTFHFGVPLYNY
jgi:hypothetical protein